MENNCPFCNSELVKEYVVVDTIPYVDTRCNKNDHSFSKRVVQRSKEVDRIKIRVTESGGDKLYLQVYFSLGYSEVWKHNNIVPRTKINQIFDIDYNTENLCKKIKTALVFS